MTLQWLTVEVTHEADGFRYKEAPERAESYTAAMTQVAVRHGLGPARAHLNGEPIAPLLETHVLLDLMASGVSDGDLERLVLEVPLIAVIFEAGRIVGHREAYDHEE